MSALLEAPAETVRGGEIVTTPHTCRWLKRPVMAASGRAKGILCIDGVAYLAETSWIYHEERREHWQVVDLHRTHAGRSVQHHRLLFGPGNESKCDCQHSTYRGCLCKHLSAVSAAMAWLDQVEALETQADAVIEQLTAAYDAEIPIEGENSNGPDGQRSQASD